MHAAFNASPCPRLPLTLPPPPPPGAHDPQPPPSRSHHAYVSLPHGMLVHGGEVVGGQKVASGHRAIDGNLCAALPSLYIFIYLLTT